MPSAAGVSRSATLVCAYLMKAKRLSHAEALHMVKRARPKIEPNKGNCLSFHLAVCVSFY